MSLLRFNGAFLSRFTFCLLKKKSRDFPNVQRWKETAYTAWRRQLQDLVSFLCKRCKNHKRWVRSLCSRQNANADYLFVNSLLLKKYAQVRANKERDGKYWFICNIRYWKHNENQTRQLDTNSWWALSCAGITWLLWHDESSRLERWSVLICSLLPQFCSINFINRQWTSIIGLKYAAVLPNKLQEYIFKDAEKKKLWTIFFWDEVSAMKKLQCLHTCLVFVGKVKGPLVSRRIEGREGERAQEKRISARPPVASALRLQIGKTPIHSFCSFLQGSVLRACPSNHDFLSSFAIGVEDKNNWAFQFSRGFESSVFFARFVCRNACEQKLHRFELWTVSLALVSKYLLKSGLCGFFVSTGRSLTRVIECKCYPFYPWCGTKTTSTMSHFKASDR